MNTALQLPAIPAAVRGADELKVPPTASTPVQQFHNPIPVTVGLVPVIDETGRIGLLTVRRGIEPAKGKLALPGGYLEYEDWKEGCSREIEEETGLIIPPAEISDNVTLSSVQNGTRLLIFAETQAIHAARLSGFVPNEETLELVVIYEPTELAFPTHTAQAAKIFESMEGSRKG